MRGSRRLLAALAMIVLLGASAAEAGGPSGFGYRGPYRPPGFNNGFSYPGIPYNGGIVPPHLRRPRRIHRYCRCGFDLCCRPARFHHHDDFFRIQPYPFGRF